MTKFKQFDESSYRQNKQKTLEDLLAEFNKTIDWIWIGEASRRKVTFQIDVKNRLGFFAEKSHDLIEINHDDSAEKPISDLIPTLKKFLKSAEENLYIQIIVTAFDNGLDVIFCAKRKLNFTQEQNLIKFAKENDVNVSLLIGKDFAPLLLLKQNQIFYPDFKISLTSNIFIQATKEGLKNIIKIIRDNLEKNTRVVDLYAGFGAYSFAVCDLAKSVLAVEGDQKMVDSISKNATENNLAHKLKSQMRDLFGDPLSAKELNNLDVAIVNPPRNGAGTQIEQIAKSNLKNVIYVSCNPQSFKRDAKILIDSGFKIKNLTAIDQFYKTNHLELVSTFQK